MPNRLIHRHPSPGHEGKTCTVEFTEADWEKSPFDDDVKERLDSGMVVAAGEMTLVNLVAFYERHAPAYRGIW